MVKSIKMTLAKWDWPCHQSSNSVWYETMWHTWPLNQSLNASAGRFQSNFQKMWLTQSWSLRLSYVYCFSYKQSGKRQRDEAISNYLFWFFNLSSIRDSCQYLEAQGHLNQACDVTRWWRYDTFVLKKGSHNLPRAFEVKYS